MNWTAGQTYYILVDDENTIASTRTFYIGLDSYTLGNTTAYTSWHTLAYRQAQKFISNITGSIESVSIYHNAGSGYMRLGVYADAGGYPGTRLGYTLATTVSSSTGWQKINLYSPASISNGQTIWLAWVFENNPGVGIYPTETSQVRARSTETYVYGMPYSFGTSTLANWSYSIYCTITTLPTDEVQIPLADERKSAEIDTRAVARVDETPDIETGDLKVYPNPFSNKLNFEFISAEDAYAVLEIFNISGQSIIRLLDQYVEGGVMNRIEYEPKEIVSGIYIYKLTLDKNVTVGKVIYNKQ
jgi:hypothetical protein